jgi:hypothetical protein
MEGPHAGAVAHEEVTSIVADVAEEIAEVALHRRTSNKNIQISTITYHKYVRTKCTWHTQDVYGKFKRGKERKRVAVGLSDKIYIAMA